MRRSSLALLILAALGVAASVWIFSGSGKDGAPPSPAAPRAEPAPRPEAGRLAEEPAPTASADSDLQRSAAAEPDARPLEAGFALPVPDGEGFTVRVVRKSDGSPLPHAEVFYVNVEQVDEQQMREAMAEAKSIFDLMVRFGVRYRADAAGVARLPFPTGGLWIGARKDRWFGSLEGRDPPADGSLIECTEMLTLVARVVNEAGVPQAGVPVQLRTDHQALIAFVTDEHGLATIQPLNMFVEASSSGAQFQLAIGAVLNQPVIVPVDVLDPPAEPVDLVLPVHGDLEVRVFDVQGAPWSAPGIVVLQRASETPVDLRRGDPADAHTAVVRGGVALLQPVGLGMALRVRAARADGSAFGEAVVEGPTEPGERRIVEVREQAGASFLTGTLVRADGAPVAKQRVQVEMALDSDRSHRTTNSSLRTDASGAFRMAIEDPVLPGGARRTLELRSANAAGETEIAEVDLSRDLLPGETNVGTILLTLPPLLVSGTIVDADGKPLAGVHVTARRQVFYSETDYYWDWSENASGRSGADGAFAVRGDLDGALLRVEGRQAGMWCDAPEVPPGTSGVTVRMGRAGRIQGRLLVADPGAMDQWSLLLAMEGRAGPDAMRHGARLEADGAFALEDLEPGSYRLSLSFGGREAEVAALAGLLVVGGEACADPRLDPFDARGVTGGLRITALDEDGKAIQQFQVMETLADGSDDVVWADSGVLILPQRSPPARLLIAAEDRISVEIPSATADVQVTLARGPRVRFTVRGLESLPDGWRAQLRLLSADPDAPEDWTGAHGLLDESGTCEFGSNRLGTCRAELVLLATRENRTYGAQIEIPDAIFDVRAAAGLQDFHLQLDPAKVQEAITRLESLLDGP